MTQSLFSFFQLFLIFGLFGLQVEAKKSSCVEILDEILKEQTFEVTQKSLVEKLEKIDKNDRTAIRYAVDGIFLVDYSHTVADLLSLYKSDIKNIKYPFAYNQKPICFFCDFFKRKILKIKDNDRDVFQNFRKTRSFLMEEDPGFNLEALREAHYLMMDGNIGNIHSKNIGKMRNTHIIGNERGLGITQEQYDEIIKNPYLGFDIANQKNGKIRGVIVYPTTRNLKPEILDRIESFDPHFIQKLEASPDSKSTYAELMSLLSEERFYQFSLERDELGDLDSPEKLLKYFQIVAQLQRDIISIHPFVDGNGRTTREFVLNYALYREGIPPSRIVNPGNDIYISIESWTDEIIKGSLATQNLFDDLNFRLENGLALENSSDLIFPRVPRLIDLALKKYNSKKVKESFDEIEIDDKQFLAFLEFYLKSNENLEKKLAKNPDEEVEKLVDDFVAFYRKNHIYYIHQKEGQQIVDIDLVDLDFRDTFANKSFRNKKIWENKMSTWYSSFEESDLIWRGLSSRKSKSETEIIDMFVNLSPHMLSNNIVGTGRATNTRKMKEAIFKEFDRYNEDLINGGLIQMARDHSETGPQYRTSYGYSTSRRRSVGKAFAMGAMSVGDYGKHQDLELQKLLKSRVLVAAREAKKDVDLSRLKQVRPEFSYSYGRQKEVMGVGGSDPDSIQLIQTIDENGDVIRSYIRNHNQPDEVWVVAGDFRIVGEAAKEKLIHKVELH